jgi:hypothetical protein
MGSSRTKPLTIKEIEALAAERPRTIVIMPSVGCPAQLALEPSKLSWKAA